VLLNIKKKNYRIAIKPFATKIRIALSHGNTFTPHMGILFENDIVITCDNNSQVYKYCLFHLMQNGIRCQFNDDIEALKAELKRCGAAEDITLSEPMFSLNPMHKIRDVINASFIKPQWDQNKFQVFCQTVNGIGGVTTSIKEMRDAYDTHINCKRFVQVFCYHFNLSIPDKYREILENELAIFKKYNPNDLK